MSKAVTVREWLLSDPDIGAQIDAGSFFGVGAVVDTPGVPFVVTRYLSTIRLGGGKDVYPVIISIHDEPGSYERINLLSLLVISRMKALQQFTGSTGVRVVQADYLGFGGEETDPEKGTIFRSTNWQLAVSE